MPKSAWIASALLPSCNGAESPEMFTLSRCASGSFEAMLQNGSVMMPGVISPTPSSNNSTRLLPRSRTKRSHRSRFSREGRGHIAINENRFARSIGRHDLAVVEHSVRGVFAGVCDLSEHVLYDALAQFHVMFKEKNLLMRVRIEPVGYLAVLLFVHSVQGNLAVNRLLGWRRGPEFAHAQELLSAYSEGGMRAVSACHDPRSSS